MRIFIVFAIISMMPFLLLAQNIVSINPNAANSGQTLNVTITGVGTHFAQASGTYIDFGFNQGSPTTVVNSTNAVSNTSIIANISIPSYVYSGSYYLSVYNPIDGYLFLDNAINVNGVDPPTITSITPDIANAGQTLDVTITGSNTHFSQASGTSVNFGFGFNQGSATTIIGVNSVNVLSNTSLVANVSVPPNTISANYDVSVFNNIDGYFTMEDGFQINGIDPVISISPNYAMPGQTLDVTITGVGTHFSQGSGTNLEFGFSQVSSTVINSISTLDETTILANITIPYNADIGSHYVNAYNSIDGLLMLPNGFYVGVVVGSDLLIDRNDVKVYPNPTHDKLTIETFSPHTDSNRRIELYNIHGQLLFSQRLKSNRTDVDFTKYPVGPYFLKIQSNNGPVIRRILKE